MDKVKVTLKHLKAGVTPLIVFGAFLFLVRPDQIWIQKENFLSPRSVIETKDSYDDLSRRDVAKFFIRALKLSTDQIFHISSKKAYSFIPITDSCLTLHRIVRGWLSFVEENGSKDLQERFLHNPKEERGWVLFFKKRPLGIVLEITPMNFIFFELDPFHPSLISSKDIPLRARLDSFLISGYIYEFVESYFSDFTKMIYERKEIPPVDLQKPVILPAIRWFRVSIPSFDSFWLPVFVDVFPPDNQYGIELIYRTLPRIQDGEEILVIGTGAGPEVVFIAKNRDVRVDAVDIGELEVMNTLATATFHGLKSRVHVWQSDGFERVNKRYDRILFNAPRPEFGKHSSDIQTFDPEGNLMSRILRQFENYLKPHGVFYLMTWEKDLQNILGKIQKSLDYQMISGGNNKEKSFNIYEFRQMEPHSSLLQEAL